MANFCPRCGKPTGPQDQFCEHCGAPLIPDAPAPQSAAPVQVEPQVPQSSPKKKSRLPLFLGIAVIAAAAVFLGRVFLLGGGQLTPPEPAPTPTPFVQIDPTALPTTEPDDTGLKETASPDSVPLPTMDPMRENLPDFEKYGITCDTKLHTVYDLPAVCGADQSIPTTGELEFTSYTVDPVTPEMIRFGQENGMDLNGYERKQLSSKIVFRDQSAIEQGIVIIISTDNYYNVSLFDDSRKDFTDSYEEPYRRYEILLDGETKYVYLWVSSEWNDYSDRQEYTEQVTVMVPEGYDGIVRGYRNPLTQSVELSEHPDQDDLFFFRMN